jgi:phage terminase large subunit
MRITLPNEFTPRAYQIPFMRYFDNGGDRAVAVWARRTGKDLTAMHQLCKMAHERTGAYWHVFPTFEQGRKAIWEGFTHDGKRIIENVFPAALVKSRDNQQMKIELRCGSIYRVIGSDKIEVVGAGPVGVIFSEYSVAKPKAWDLIAPMLHQNRGWAAFVYTPRGNNHGKKLYDMARKAQGWFCDIKTLPETDAYDAERTFAEERAMGRPESLIRQEYLCDWTAANAGAVFGDLIEALDKREGVGEFDHPEDGVFTAWDLGFTDATGIWFWRIRGHAAEVIAHYENHGKPLSHYFDEVDSRPYEYVKHWLPHDARAKTLASGSSILEQFIDRYGAGAVAIGPQLSLLDGIQAGRWLLQQPEFRIHSRCGDGIEALRAYHYEYDEDTKAFGRKPEHDWSSHTADAFRYLALVVKHTELVTRRPEARPQEPIRPVHERFQLNELFEDRERGMP